MIFFKLNIIHLYTRFYNRLCRGDVDSGKLITAEYFYGKPLEEHGVIVMRNLRNGESIEDSIYGTHFTEEDVQTYIKTRRHKSNNNVEIVKKDQFIGLSDAEQSDIVRKRIPAGATNSYTAFGTKYTLQQVHTYVFNSVIHLYLYCY